VQEGLAIVPKWLDVSTDVGDREKVRKGKGKVMDTAQLQMCRILGLVSWDWFQRFGFDSPAVFWRKN
jgi:hypothetical protein